MFKKLTLAAAAGAGYVLGAKAGKERYSQIEAKFREIAGMPAVKSATTTVVETASSVADTAKSAASDKVAAVADKAKGAKGDTDVVVDLGNSTPAKSSPAAKTGTTGTGSGATMAGAAASGSAPDVTRP